MRVHALQHVGFEGLGSIGSWLRSRDVELTTTHFERAAILPDPAQVDWVIVMGGPMSVHDESCHSWLRAEMAFLETALARGKCVLGVCLGAQLIAHVLGARVYPNREREIGWHAIRAVSPVEGSQVFGLPAEIDVFHWHGETFDLPRGAVHLARSAACENQAFQIGENVIGLQFHLETTADSARALVDHCPADLQPARWVQSAEEILAAPADRYRAVNTLMEDLLGYLARTIDPALG